MDYQINFPNLHISLEHVGKQISIGNVTVAYYGIIIAVSILVGIKIACMEAKRTGQREEDYLDLAFFAVIFAVIGARLYYVIFEWDYYSKNLKEIFMTWHGGLAIYGGIIGAVIAVYVVTKVKKKSFPLFLDTACLGLVVGQVIGRWGNFFNREAFGAYTDGIFAMQLPVSAVRAHEVTQQMWEHVMTIQGVEYIQVHPTFLYEGLWNCMVFAALMLYRNHKAFTGEVFLLYVFGYGLGRIWIEGLRTDQLTIGRTGIPASQILSFLLIVSCIIVDIYVRVRATKRYRQ